MKLKPYPTVPLRWVFRIKNFNEVDAAQPDAVARLESALAGLGALPACSRIVADVTIYVVEVTNPNLNRADVRAAFEAIGFQVDQEVSDE